MAPRALTVAAAIVVAALGIAAETSAHHGFTTLGALDWLAGAGYLAAAVVIAGSNRGLAAVAILVALTWFAGTLAGADGALARLGTAAVLTYRAPLLHLLAAPVRGRLVGSVVLLGYLGVLAPASVAAPITIGVGVVVGVAGLRAAAHAAADRRAVLTARAVLALGFSVLWAFDRVLPVAAQLGAALLDLAMLAGALLTSVGRGSAWAAAPGLLVDLGPSRAAAAPVTSVLAQALDAPDLEVRYRPRGGTWRDELGAEATGPPPPDAVFAAAPDGGEVALVGCPPDIAAGELAQVAAASAGLALADTRALVRLRQRNEEIEASRRRLLKVSDSERQAIGDRVRTGPITRLVHIRDAFTGPADPELVRELDIAISELKTLSDGLYPNATLRDLASRFEPAATIEVGADVELSPAHHALVGFICAECLTNAARHAPGANITIAVETVGGELRVEVTDDGPGGALLREGGGLQGLADRIQVAGGRLTLSSPAGGPTRVVARVPVPPRR